MKFRRTLYGDVFFQRISAGCKLYSESSSCSKVFEMCRYNIIFSYFKPWDSPSQHWFVPRRSTTTNLLVVTQFLSEAIAAGDQVNVVHTDFSKAFGTVSIPLLIQRLQEIDLPSCLVGLLDSYFVDRKLPSPLDTVTCQCPFLCQRIFLLAALLAYFQDSAEPQPFLWAVKHCLPIQ